MTNKLLRNIGILLILDGLLSIWWSLPDECLNNSTIGQIVRLIRAGIGGYLVYKFK